jgi:hypothetical protein
MGPGEMSPHSWGLSVMALSHMLSRRLTPGHSRGWLPSLLNVREKESRSTLRNLMRRHLDFTGRKINSEM